MIMCTCYIPGPSDETRTRMPSGGRSSEAFCLTLPGNLLDVPALLKDKKFRHRGNKEGALQAMKVLTDDGLGKLEEKQTKGSVKVGDFRQFILQCASKAEYTCKPLYLDTYHTYHSCPHI